MRRSFPNSEPISRLKTFFELFSVWLDSMLPIYSFRHCEKQNAPLAVTLFNEMHTPPPPPPIYILFSPVILGGYHGIKEKKAWNAYSLTTGFIGIMPILTQSCIMCTLIQINPMSLSFNFIQCDGKFVNTPSAFYQGFSIIGGFLRAWSECQSSIIAGLLKPWSECQSSIIAGLFRASWQCQ